MPLHKEVRDEEDAGEDGSRDDRPQEAIADPGAEIDGPARRVGSCRGCINTVMI
jgi:hypothetical protein